MWSLSVQVVFIKKYLFYCFSLFLQATFDDINRFFCGGKYLFQGFYSVKGIVQPD
jgi:hypothetical protein